jgi:hypothetical protein
MGKILMGMMSDHVQSLNGPLDEEPNPLLSAVDEKVKEAIDIPGEVHLWIGRLV